MMRSFARWACIAAFAFVAGCQWTPGDASAEAILSVRFSGMHAARVGALGGGIEAESRLVVFVLPAVDLRDELPPALEFDAALDEVTIGDVEELAENAASAASLVVNAGRLDPRASPGGTARLSGLRNNDEYHIFAFIIESDADDATGTVVARAATLFDSEGQRRRGVVVRSGEKAVDLSFTAWEPGEFIYIAAGSEVKKLDAGGNRLWSYGGHSDTVQAVAVDATGFVYSGSRDRTVHKISPSGMGLWTAEFDARVRAVAVDGDGAVYVGLEDEAFWKLSADGQSEWSLPLPSVGEFDNWTFAVAVNPEDEIVVGLRDGTVRGIVEQEDGEPQQAWSFEGEPDEWVRGVVARSFQAMVFTAGHDSVLRAIERNNGEADVIWDAGLAGEDGQLYAVASDNADGLYSGGNLGELWKYRLDEEGPAWEDPVYSGPPDPDDGARPTIRAIAASPDGSVYFNAGSMLRKITQEGEVVWDLEQSAGGIQAIAVDPGLPGAFPAEW